MNPSTPPTLKQLKALGYSDEKFIALNALKNRSLIVNKSENFDSQCRNVIIDYAKTVTAASNLMEVIENAQEIDKVVDELYILKLAASKEQEKLNEHLQRAYSKGFSAGQKGNFQNLKGL